MKNILNFWRMKDSIVEEVTETTWKINNTAILKRNKDENTIKRNLGIIRSLKSINFPVPYIIQTKDKHEYIELDGQFYMMTEILTGNHLSIKEGIINDQLSYKIGHTIANLQKGLKRIENQYDFRDNNFLDELNGWIRVNITSKGSGYYAENVFDECVRLMNEVYPKLKRQPIHRDVHLGNMLFKNDEITGYIDFDISQVNARLFDLAYMGAGALAEVFEDVDLRSIWYKFLEEMIQGFNSVSQLDVIEEKSIGLLMASIEILFVAYFISIDNLEFAKSADNVLKWIWESDLVKK